ncbi:MAG: hypothetical protein VKO39_08210 [Cyanobacteriota bacterium]|nr:hypothetical protein [Cyanobacteriota bacterium]
MTLHAGRLITPQAKAGRGGARGALSLALVALLLTGCDERVNSHYTTYREAAKDQLFARGWLPEIIPASSTNITTRNDLDLNRSEGEFWFPPGATEAFLSRLVPYSGHGALPPVFKRMAWSDRAKGYSLHEFQRDQNVWVFALNRQTGHAIYNLTASRHAPPFASQLRREGVVSPTVPSLKRDASENGIKAIFH